VARPAARDAPVPVVVYQHGNPGSDAEVLRYARRSLAAAGFAVIGFTDPLNREVSPPGPPAEQLAHRQIVDILLRLLATRRLPDYFVQAVGEQLALLRALEQLAAPRRFTARRDEQSQELHGLDLSRSVAYLGISEGAHHGSLLLPYAPEIRAAVLVGAGRRFGEVLIHQQSEQLAGPLAFLGFRDLSASDLWVVLALVQLLLDPQDPHNHARFLYREPLELNGTLRRASLLLVEGLEDSLVPNHATEALAAALGPLPQLAPVARAVTGLAALPAPIQANVDPRTSAALVQYVPQGVEGIAPTPGCSSPPLSESSAAEGHYCAQSAAEAVRLRDAFFRSALRDAAPRIGDGAAP
jgi:hypothetical protein